MRKTRIDIAVANLKYAAKIGSKQGVDEWWSLSVSGVYLGGLRLRDLKTLNRHLTNLKRALKRIEGHPNVGQTAKLIARSALGE